MYLLIFILIFHSVLSEHLKFYKKIKKIQKRPQIKNIFARKLVEKIAVVHYKNLLSLSYLKDIQTSQERKFSFS